MEFIRTFFENLRKKRIERRNRRIEQVARIMFEIEEYDGQLWFTCNDVLFCPCSLLSGDKDESAVDMLITIRNLYIERRKR